MNKEEQRKLAKRNLTLGMIMGIIIGTLLGAGMLGPDLYKERVKSEALTELLIFSLNVSEYCAELNNMTTEEVLDGYVLKMAYELIGDASLGGNE